MANAGAVPPEQPYPATQAQPPMYYRVPQAYYFPPNVEYGYPVGRSFLFDDITVRHKFIRRMYIILFLTWLITLIVTLLFIFVSPLTTFVHTHFWIIGVPALAHVVLLCIFICCLHIRKRYPTNLILLFCMGATFGMICGIICVCYAGWYLLIAIGAVVILILVLILFALQTRFEFLGILIIPIVVVTLLIIFGLCCIAAYFRTMTLLIWGLAVFAYAIYLIIDTLLILGNKRYCLCEEEYINGAISLFIDKQNWFTCIVNIMNNL